MHQISRQNAKKAALILAASGVLALGIAAPTMSWAQEKSGLKDRLAAAVESGKLTQAEADAIVRAAAEGLLNPDREPGREPGLS